MSEKFKGSMDATPSLQSLPNGYDINAAYLLWYCVGYLGIHNFYLKRASMGIIIAILFIAGLATIPIKFGVIPLSIVAILLIIDFVRLPVLVKDKNMELIRRQKVLEQAL